MCEMVLRITIKNNESALDGITEIIPGAKQGVVLFHPHPLYGGDMHNDVIISLAEVVESNQLTTLRFDFRGAGKSGSYVGIQGALKDAHSAIRYMRERLGVSSIGAIGYSFGASISLAVSLSEDFNFIVALSPSLGLLEDTGHQVEDLCTISCRCLLFHGARDDVISIDDMHRISQEIGPNAEIHILENEGHFYSCTMNEVKKRLKVFLDSIRKV